MERKKSGKAFKKGMRWWSKPYSNEKYGQKKNQPTNLALGNAIRWLVQNATDHISFPFASTAGIIGSTFRKGYD